MSRSASLTSSSVALNDSINVCGSLRKKSDRVGEQHALLVRQNEAARGRIERGEKSVFRDDVRAGEQIQQRRFAGIGVTDHGRDRPLMAFPSLRAGLRASCARLRARAPAAQSVPARGGDRLPAAFRPARACRCRRSAAKGGPHSRQAREQILQLRQLDLQSAFAAAGALRENIENQLRAIEHFARKQIFQIASLRRRKFVVENDRSHLLILERFLDQFGFASCRCNKAQSASAIFA